MAWDSVWEDVYRTRAWGRYPGEDVVRFVMGHFGRREDRASTRLLEVGCGSGANLWFMAREGFNTHGVDRAPTAVDLCQRRLDAECPQWRAHGGAVQQADLLTLPYSDEDFNAVIDIVAICYSPFAQAQAAYRELARVTRPGGRLLARTFAHGCWGDGTGQELEAGFWACDQGPLAHLGGTRFTTEGEVRDLCQGWHIERIERSCFSEDDRLHDIRHLIIHGIKR